MPAPPVAAITPASPGPTMNAKLPRIEFRVAAASISRTGRTCCISASIAGLCSAPSPDSSPATIHSAPTCGLASDAFQASPPQQTAIADSTITNQPPPFEMIGERLRQSAPSQHGRELHNSNQSDRQRRPSERIHLEWQHDIGHCGSERRDELAKINQPKFTRTKRTDVGQVRAQGYPNSLP